MKEIGIQYIVDQTPVYVGDVVEYEIPPLRALYWGTMIEEDGKFFVEKEGFKTPLNRCRIKRKVG